MAGIAPQRRVAASGMPGWSPFAQPTSPPVVFDLFNDGVIGPTEFDPGNVTTITEEIGDRLVLHQAGPGAELIGGAVYPIPSASALNVTLGTRGRGLCNDYAAFGLLLGGSDMLSAPSTARLLALYNLLAGGPQTRVEAATYQRYNLFDTSHCVFPGTGPGRNYPFLRIHYNEASLGLFAFLVGDDANGWTRIGSINKGAGNLGGAAEPPAFGGPYVVNLDTGEDLSALVPLFRVDITDDMYAPTGEWFDE